MLYDRRAQSLTNFPQPLLMPPDLRCAMSFWAPLKNATWAQGRGSGTPTYSGGAVSGAGAVYYADDPLGTGLLVPTTSGAPVFTSQGYQALGAIENLCLYSNDLTQAGSWTASNITPALTSIGPDGAANSACRLTATAGNGTILQAITSASAARITFMYVKRITGTGNIDITQDNGSTWTTVTTTAGWTKVNLTAATAANPTVGIRIVTNTDAIDVWGFTHAKIAFAFPGTLQTAGATAARTGDVLTYPAGGCIDSTRPGTVVGTMSVADASVVGFLVSERITGPNDGVTVNANSTASNTIIQSYSNGNSYNAQCTFARVNGVPYKYVATWDASSISLSVNGQSKATAAALLSLRQNSSMFVSCNASSIAQPFGTLNRYMVAGIAVSDQDAARLR